MNSHVNDQGQPVGDPLANWTEPRLPQRQTINGRLAQLVPLDAQTHAAALFQAFAEDAAGTGWTYLPYGPFPEFESFQQWLAEQSTKQDPMFFAVVDVASGAATGVVSYLRITPGMGTIEIGHIHFSPALQGTATATEALFLMLQWVFDGGYRRCEWKCNALNQASRRAAVRLGFRYEGTFRQAAVVKGRNRDTAWYAMLDKEWPQQREAFLRWLDPANFFADGRQRQALSAFRDQPPTSSG